MPRFEQEFQHSRWGGVLRGPLIATGVVMVGIVAVMLVCAGLVERPPDLTQNEKLLSLAKQALDKRDFVEAERRARAAIQLGNESGTELGTGLQGGAWIIAGEAAVQQNRFEDGVECFLKVTSEGGDRGALAHSLAGDVLARRLFRLRDAEHHYREALKIKPNQSNALRGLVALLAAEGRRREALPLLLNIVRSGEHTEQHLFLLGNVRWVLDTISYKTRAGDVTVKRTRFLGQALEQVPDDPLPRIGLARIAEAGNQPAAAVAFLETVLAADPDQHEARGLLGQLLARTATDADFLEWYAGAPEAAEREPGVWFARATWARRRGQHRVAARCYRECLVHDPNHVAANLQLAHALARLDRDAEAAEFHRRVVRLTELTTLLRGLSGDPRFGTEKSGDRYFRVVELNRELGRVWEAYAWSVIAIKQDSELTWPKDQLDAIGKDISKNPGQTLAAFHPASSLDLADLPRPDWSAASALSGKTPGQNGVAYGPIRFRNDAGSSGLDFRYYSGQAGPDEESRLPETVGGGAGVLDFDRDGWPDLYLAQGNRWPIRNSTEHADRLFRNRGDGHFQDITDQAGLAQFGYGQGVTIGDINNDGFPDVFVANVGGNRLLVNNGDGTFGDITETAGLKTAAWSVSGLLADLNGDTFPDLYVVNYLADEDVFRASCPPGTPSRRPCGPGDFAAAQDRVFLNTGDGRFRDVTETSGIASSDGKGLGIVAVDFDGSGRLDLFVANDTRANFFYRNRPARERGGLSLENIAMTSGVAFNAEGEPQGCMGIAVHDVNGDGKMDLFVTNYIGQPNTLYSWGGESVFLDHTRKRGLYDAGFSMVGWGTEFLDADLDGHADLLMANGHIAGHVHEGERLAMPPLAYRNSGDGTFELLPGKNLGKYFTGMYVGRGLARIDWNRDGREDAVVTHLGSPLALLTNRTDKTGHFLALRLVGTRSSRDAIGATVQVSASGKTWTSQLTAGDGFLVSNQRQLVLGLGQVTSIQRLSIRWPSGERQELTNLAVDRELVLVEGRGSWVVSGDQPSR